MVVGGGPVGLAAAIEARLAGHEVVVLEPRSGPVDKACGEGLMPGTLAALLRLGVDPEGHALAGISYRRDGAHVDHRFRSPGRGVRRTTLHAALRARADELGVAHREQRVRTLTLEPDGAVVDGIRARHVLACDGLHSTVSRLLGLDVAASRGGARRYGVRRHHAVAPWTDLVEVHWTPHAELYVTPVGPELVGVAALGPTGTDLADQVALAPELAGRLEGAPVVGTLRGAGPLLRRTARRTCGAVRLVGDASGYVDALTGEGLRVGLAQAHAAIATLEDASAYEREWRRVTRDYRLLTAGLVTWATSPLRPAVVPVARRVPWLYGAVVDRLAR
nr:NAD(P)/FAD-dependent oxidoreductase [Cellulomonas sp. APG4]